MANNSMDEGMTQMRYYEKAFFCILHGTVYFCIILYNSDSDQTAL